MLAARVEFQGEELPLRSAQAKLAVLASYADRDELGELAGDVSASFNDERLELLRAGETLEAELSGRATTRSRGARRRSASRSASSSARSPARATAADGRLRRAARALVRAPARPRARAPAELVPRRRTCAASRRSRHLHEGARVPVCMDTLAAPRLRPRGRAEHQARPRRPPAEVAARLRDPVRPAERRPPDHPRAGRAPRLPGVPARGRPRAALRGLRPERCRTPSATSRATTR